MHSPDITHNKIPITVLQGFLGAGKTTLLNYILTHNEGMNIGVVVNDFGDINIDSELIAQKTDKRLELTSGCICCSLQTLDLQQAIEQFVTAESTIDYIIIEASGLAEPRDLSNTLRFTLGQSVRLDSIVTVLDAANLSENATDHAQIARDQLMFTDFVVLNKVDMATPARLKEIYTMIASFNPKARVIETVRGELDVRLILDTDVFSHREQPAKATRDEHSHDHDDHSEHLHSHYTTMSWESKRPLDPIKFQQFINRLLPTAVYRAKGVVDFGTKGQDRRYIFQLVGVRPELSWENWHGRAEHTQLVFIGRDFDSKVLKKHLDDCVDAKPSDPLPKGIELKLPKRAEL